MMDWAWVIGRNNRRNVSNWPIILIMQLFNNEHDDDNDDNDNDDADNYNDLKKNHFLSQHKTRTYVALVLNVPDKPLFMTMPMM